jgi:tetratricopeptide (TPR) repeat protein
MSKSMVEKYEQMLSQDPSSTVFVELARAYLDKGENERAIEVCKSGCGYHPSSIAGRVLWGKALINSGRAAEAMQQFDAAVNIDRENPHAYNLISEVLLRKGLYRSALPILRKASSLQPNDGRIKQWLEQARSAVAGGPAPVLYETTSASEAYASLDEPKTASMAPAAPPPPPVEKVAAKAVPPPSIAPVTARPSAPPLVASTVAEGRVAEGKASPKQTGPRASGPAPNAPLVPMEPPAMDDVFAAFAKATPDPRAEQTVLMAAYTPQASPPLAGAGVPPAVSSTSNSNGPVSSTPSKAARDKATPKSGAVKGGAAAPPAPPLDDRPGPPVPTQEMPFLPAAKTAEEGRPTIELPSSAVGIGEGLPPSGELPLVVGTLETGTPGAGEASAESANASASLDPFGAFLGDKSDSNEVFHGLTSTFQALQQAEVAPVPAPLPSTSERDLSLNIPSVDIPGPPGELSAPPVPTPPPDTGNHRALEDVISEQAEIPTSEYRIPNFDEQTPGPPVLATIGNAPTGSRGLLDEIPDETHEGASPTGESHRVEFSTVATEAIAREYERELREKLIAKQQEKTFLQRHGLKLALTLGGLVVTLALAGSFALTRRKHGGENLDSALNKGLVAVSADTKEQYQAGIQSLQQALAMEENNVDAWANVAFAKAVLFAEHGGAPADREAALAAVEKPRVREAHPDLSLVIDFLTADAAASGALKQQIVSSQLNLSAVETQAGRILLAEKKFDDAFKRLQKAAELNARNTRALVALGDYYLASEDYESAARVLGAAEAVSRFHPQRVMGLAEARLELGREASEALADLESLTAPGASVPDAASGRYALLLGRAQSAAGKHDEAAKTLRAGLASFQDLAFQFQMALGVAGRNAGRMADAQVAYEEALKLRPKNEDAKEGLGRVLLARSREKELLDRLKIEGDQRKVALVRGIAASRLDDTKRARAELAKTQVSGKYPSEAAVYLALADAADEGGDKAVALLEKFVSTNKRNKPTAQIALARVYMKRNELMKARAQLEDAARDPLDYEANALLGQLYLEALDMGVPAEAALAPLQRAVERNGSHAPSRHLLTRTLINLGRFADALKQVEGWTTDNPAAEDAWVDAALAYWQAGRATVAEQAIQKGVKDTSGAEAFRIKAQVLFARGDSRNAFAALERANKLNSKDAATFCEIGNAFVRQGNADTALKAYEAARREDPKSLCGILGPHHARPSAKSSKPTAKEELEELDKRAFSALDKAVVQATLARVLLEEKDVASAADVADAASKIHPYSAVAWFAVGEVAKRAKDDAKALEAFGKAAQFDQSWSGARLAYADALIKSGAEGAKQALAEYEAVLTLSQNEADLARVRRVVATLKTKYK